MMMQLDWTRPSWSNGCGLCLTCMSLSQTVHSIHSSSCKKFQATLSLAERKARHCHVAGRKMYRQCPPKIWACFGAHLRKGETIMFAMAHICRHVFQRILSTKLPCGFERVAGKKTEPSGKPSVRGFFPTCWWLQVSNFGDLDAAKIQGWTSR